MQPIYLSAFTASSALGHGLKATLHALQSEQSGLRENDFQENPIPTWIGRVEGIEQEKIPAALSAYDCRNNRLAQIGLQQDGFVSAVERAKAVYGADRVGVILGTSTSGNLETEIAFRFHKAHGAWPASMHFREQHNLFGLADFVRLSLAVSGPSYVISTACSSSAKVFASAARFLSLIHI